NKIFESSSFHAEIGAGIVLPPNGGLILKALLPELNWENLQTVDFRSMNGFKSDGTPEDSIDLSDGWNKYPQGWLTFHRVDLHKELMHLALDADAHALPPASIRLGSPITAVNFDPENPSVTTFSGEEFKFDLILGTDGIKSTIRTCMVGAEHDAPPSFFGFYRWMVDLKKHPELSWIHENRKTTGSTNVIGKSMFLFMYPLRNGNLINISGAHHDKRDQNAVGWNEEVPMDTFLKAFEDYGDKFMGFVNVAENPRVWQVRSLKAIPTWTKGNVALLGDAAHAMFPTYGQGFAMGLEDAATLVTLLPRGTKVSDISSRVKIFQDIRKPRAERVGQLSAEGMQGGADVALMWVLPEVYEYDAIAIAEAALAKI
ncbi:FAD/NAD(P)-binding domain-containing protein, partial [Mycena leptocephala]